MTSLHDLSIDAADSARGLEIFRREGVVVVKGLLPGVCLVTVKYEGLTAQYPVTVTVF